MKWLALAMAKLRRKTMKKKPSQILAAPLALAAVRAAGYDVMRDSLVDTMVQVAYTVWEG